VAELVAAFFMAHGLLSLLADVNCLLDPSGGSVRFPVIGQDRKVEATFGKGYTKSGILNVLRGSNRRNISPCSGVVVATKEWVLLY